MPLSQESGVCVVFAAVRLRMWFTCCWSVKDTLISVKYGSECRLTSTPSVMTDHAQQLRVLVYDRRLAVPIGCDS